MDCVRKCPNLLGSQKEVSIKDHEINEYKTISQLIEYK